MNHSLTIADLEAAQMRPPTGAELVSIQQGMTATDPVGVKVARHAISSIVDNEAIPATMLLVRRGDIEIEFHQGTAIAIVGDSQGKPLFRWIVDVVLDEDQKCLRRGRQIFETIPNGPPELTGGVLSRALLGEAWAAVLERMTITRSRNATSLSRSAGRPKGRSRKYENVEIAAEDEICFVGEKSRAYLLEHGRPISTRELALELTKYRGAQVSEGMARIRKHEARTRGMLPAAESTRPST